MLAGAILEQPFNLHDVFEEAFLIIKRFWQVSEPIRITKEPVAWVTMDDRDGSAVAVVLRVSNDKFIYMPVSGPIAHYDQACYVKNLSPEVNPISPVVGNTVTLKAFTRVNEVSPTDKCHNVIEMKPVSSNVQKLLRSVWKPQGLPAYMNAKPI